MSKTQRDIKPIILQGSAALVAEYFHYSVNAILYQRGVRPMENFAQETYCGMPVFVSTETKVRNGLKSFTKVAERYLAERKVKKLDLCIMKTDAEEPLERWVFDIEYEGLSNNELEGNPITSNLPIAGNKDEEKTKNEICQVFRQITGSVSFLPLIACPCVYYIRMVAPRGVPKPIGWRRSLLAMGECEQVQLRSFSTSLHKVHTKIYYKDY